MPFTAGDVIEQARGLDPAFTRERHPSAVLYPFLKRTQRHYVSEWLQKDSRALMTAHEVPLPLDPFENGHELVDGADDPLSYLKVHEPAEVHRESAGVWDECKIIDFHEKNSPRHFPSVWIQNGVVYLTDIADRWTAYDKVRLWITETPADITGSADEFVLPDQAEEAVVRELGAFLAGRAKQSELANPKAKYVDDAQGARLYWLNEIYHRQGATKGERRGV